MNEDVKTINRSLLVEIVGVEGYGIFFDDTHCIDPDSIIIDFPELKGFEYKFSFDPKLNRIIFPEIRSHQKVNVSYSYREKFEKPPLGLRPKAIHETERIREIMDAIDRLLSKGCDIPEIWVEELSERIDSIRSGKTI